MELAKLALEKSDDQGVKDLAQKVIADHGKTVEELEAIAMQKNITLPPTPGENHVEKIKDLSEISGVDFDIGYMEQAVADRSKVVSLFEVASEEADDPEIKDFAIKSLPKLKQHQEIAKELRDSVSNGMESFERVVPSP
ncbi:DUF4142 domain-containing protein [Parapedobacter tibetensis]|uniref:DUF4142 domain-containing protein n=1 Tax=Parapedobacter tibetensis TaxID=2972951 RepID=UPI00214D75A6|nr:DUF4142 domain-containing protein [Parapedobacter tibetensis]